MNWGPSWSTTNMLHLWVWNEGITSLWSRRQLGLFQVNLHLLFCRSQCSLRQSFPRISTFVAENTRNHSDSRFPRKKQGFQLCNETTTNRRTFRNLNNGRRPGSLRVSSELTRKSFIDSTMDEGKPRDSLRLFKSGHLRWTRQPGHGAVSTF